MDHNAASPDATIAAEDASLIAGTRPDLVIREADGRVTVLEIVVTHDLEDKTRALYKASDFPVLSKSFKGFDDLKGLESIFAADSSLNVLDSSDKWCEKCEETFERRKLLVDKAVAQMKRRPSTTLLFKIWRSRGRSWETRQLVVEQAKILSELGFQQSMKYPAQFGFPIHEHPNKSIHLIAEVDFLWSVVPHVHGLNHKWESDRRICRYIINTVGKRLASEGIDDDHIERYWHYADNDIDSYQHQQLGHSMSLEPFE